MTLTEGPTNPLLDLLRMMKSEEQTAFAHLAGTERGYLYQVAGGHRKNISVQLAFGIEDASRQISKQSGGHYPIVTARMLADMGAVSGLTPTE